MIPHIGMRVMGSRQPVDNAIRRVDDRRRENKHGVWFLTGLALLLTVGGLVGLFAHVATPGGGMIMIVCAVGALTIAFTVRHRAARRLPAIRMILADPRTIGVDTNVLGVDVVYKPDEPNRSDDGYDGDRTHPLATILWRVDRPATTCHAYAYVPEADWMTMTGMPIPDKPRHGPERRTMITISLECSGTTMTIINIQPIPIDMVIREYKRDGEHHVPENTLTGRGNDMDDMIVGVTLP